MWLCVALRERPEGLVAVCEHKGYAFVSERNLVIASKQLKGLVSTKAMPLLVSVTLGLLVRTKKVALFAH